MQVLNKHKLRKLHQRLGERETKSGCGSQRNTNEAINGCSITRKRASQKGRHNPAIYRDEHNFKRVGWLVLSSIGSLVHELVGWAESSQVGQSRQVLGLAVDNCCKSKKDKSESVMNWNYQLEN